jgi:hypothetical protein
MKESGKRHGEVCEAQDDGVHDASVIVGELQRFADSHETVQPAEQANGRLRILFVVGSSSPWRAIENDREVSHRRMMCFRDFTQVQRFVLDHFDRQRAYEKFAEHLATPAGIPGITAESLPSHSLYAVLDAYRDEIGDRPYRTVADRIVTLTRS